MRLREREDTGQHGWRELLKIIGSVAGETSGKTAGRCRVIDGRVVEGDAIDAFGYHWIAEAVESHRQRAEGGQRHSGNSAGNEGLIFRIAKQMVASAIADPHFARLLIHYDSIWRVDTRERES